MIEPTRTEVELERALIGALLYEPKAIREIASDVRASDFAVAPHRAIFNAVAAVTTNGHAPDSVIVADYLARTNHLEAIGGRQYLADLIAETTSAASVSIYARKVRDAADKRYLRTIIGDMAHIAGERDPDDALRYAQGSLSDFAARRKRAQGGPAALDWLALQSQTPPVREWADEHWFGMGHVTLLAGAGGSGKTSVAQALGSCLALGRDYLNRVGLARRVLMWAAEDDTAELWRRQIAIAEWLRVPLGDFAGRLFLHSYDGEQVELATLLEQRQLVSTPQYQTLCQQIGDYKADVVILDNVARLYGADENNRHQVTGFVAMLTAAARATNAAVMLLAHPGKAAGSEYSGSTAWEGAVRARLYLGRTLPNADVDADGSAGDESVRYLCRRKANYSPLDWRRLAYVNGVMVPEAPVSADQGGQRASPLYARTVVMGAVRKLAEMGEHGSASTASPSYLPKLAKQYRLLDQCTEREFGAAMREMRKDGTLLVQVVGKYQNRTPREGLVLANEVHK